MIQHKREAFAMTTELDVARDFSAYPFGRYPEHGPDNGQRFRDEQLIPALRAGGRVIVDLTGARGLAPSFLEEAFGGLIRAGFSQEDLDARLVVKSSVDPSLVREVRGYIEEAARRARAVH